jgi:lysyl-tRNA synthetase class 2
MTDRLRAALTMRAKLYALIREFFGRRNVLEVETPILSSGANIDPNIQSFSTRFSGRGAGDRWLRTSSEFAQKRLLAAGVGDCYELGRVFRDGEAGRRHNPEFTMLEWYRIGRDHRWLIGETIELIQAALQLVDREASVRMLSYRDLFCKTVGVDPFAANESELRAALGDTVVDPDGLSRDDWLDLLLTHHIQPNFPADTITVVFDYPATQCALAKIRRDDPPVAERFEVYVGTHELANGYHELTDAAEQRSRFVRDNERRRARGLPAVPIDEHFLAALERGLPDCAGVALGIERLLMAMLRTENIADVLAFAFAEA